MADWDTDAGRADARRGDDARGDDARGDDARGDDLRGDNRRDGGARDDGMRGDSMRDDGMCGDGMRDDVMRDDGARDDGVCGDSVRDDGACDDGAGDATGGDETTGDTMTGDAALGDGAGGDPVAAGAPRRDAAGRFVARAGSGESATRRRTRRRAGGKRAPARPPVAWSAGGEALFLEALARTSCVAEAIRASGFSETNVYRRKRKFPAFRAKWAEALREGYGRLQGMLLDRALNGIEVAVYHGGKRIGTKREYNDGTALALLRMHREAVMGAQPVAADEPIERVRARLKTRLSEMNRRMGGGG